LYLEYDPKENIEDVIEVQENQYSTLGEEENEIEAHEGRNVPNLNK